MKKLFVLIGFIVVAFTGMAQDQSINQKGGYYFYWGYNRSTFAASDIHFTGPGYDFTLNQVQAFDRPTAFTFKDYFAPQNMWIPQYVYRLGYFINDHWSISLGLDHMKYIMQQNQPVAIEGDIDLPENPYNGSYNGESIYLTPNFLTYEHSDGLNYLSASADYHYIFYQIPSQKFAIEAYGGAGLGLQIPKSNVQLFGENRNDQFHLAGWGMHGNVGFRFIGWKFLFLRTGLKGGFNHMPDILTRSGDGPDRASQLIWFGMWDFAIGAQWHF